MLAKQGSLQRLAEMVRPLEIGRRYGRGRWRNSIVARGARRSPRDREHTSRSCSRSECSKEQITAAIAKKRCSNACQSFGTFDISVPRSKNQCSSTIIRSYIDICLPYRCRRSPRRSNGHDLGSGNRYADEVGVQVDPVRTDGAHWWLGPKRAG